MSTSYYDRLKQRQKLERPVKLARTYIRQARDLLHDKAWGDKGKPLPTLYWDLLGESLELAETIIEYLPDDFFVSGEVEDFFGLRAAMGDLALGKYNSSDDPLEAARKVVAAIEKRRERGDGLLLIMALENVNGRTPEEAEQFLKKAAELRRKLEIPKEVVE